MRGSGEKKKRNLDVSLVEKKRGGNTGERTLLIDQGKKWVSTYSKFGGDIEKTIEKSYEKHIREFIKWARQ